MRARATDRRYSSLASARVLPPAPKNKVRAGDDGNDEGNRDRYPAGKSRSAAERVPVDGSRHAQRRLWWWRLGFDRRALVELTARECRFADCAHETEPGCAVLDALDSGELPERRWASYVKLQREARWMAMRRDARLRAQERARWKRITKEYRQGKIRP